jgi:hypothetical protein
MWEFFWRGKISYPFHSALIMPENRIIYVIDHSRNGTWMSTREPEINGNENKISFRKIRNNLDSPIFKSLEVNLNKIEIRD